MPTDVIMPVLGMAQETGRVLRWHKAEGDAVVKGEPLLEIETDKVTVDVEAPADGTLAGVCAAEGEEVPVGRAVAVVLAADESLPVAAAAPGAGRARARLASPKARRLAAARGVDLAALAGSGPNGAVVAADVEAYAGAAAPPASADSGAHSDVPNNTVLQGEGGGGDERAAGTASPSPLATGAAGPLAVGPVWRRMAERTAQSWQAVPHFRLRREVDASRLESWRAVARAKPGGEATSHTDLLVKIAAEALRRHPRVNASWREGTLLPGEGINVGVAVATPDGLVVPVVHDADRLTLTAIAARRAEAVAAAREGRLRPEDVAGGTFTISNLGMYGVDGFDAIVNAPQAAILAVGRIRERIVPVDGAPAVRPVLELSLSFDHRVVDGARGAEFLETLASLVEEPAGLVD